MFISKNREFIFYAKVRNTENDKEGIKLFPNMIKLEKWKTNDRMKLWEIIEVIKFPVIQLEKSVHKNGKKTTI